MLINERSHLNPASVRRVEPGYRAVVASLTQQRPDVLVALRLDVRLDEDVGVEVADLPRGFHQLERVEQDAVFADLGVGRGSLLMGGGGIGRKKNQKDRGCSGETIENSVRMGVHGGPSIVYLIDKDWREGNMGAMGVIPPMEVLCGLYSWKTERIVPEVTFKRPNGVSNERTCNVASSNSPMDSTRIVFTRHKRYMRNESRIRIETRSGWKATVEAQG